MGGPQAALELVELGDQRALLSRAGVDALEHPAEHPPPRAAVTPAAVVVVAAPAATPAAARAPAAVAAVVVTVPAVAAPVHARQADGAEDSETDCETQHE